MGRSKARGTTLLYRSAQANTRWRSLTYNVGYNYNWDDFLNLMQPCSIDIVEGGDPYSGLNEHLVQQHRAGHADGQTIRSGSMPVNTKPVPRTPTATRPVGPAAPCQRQPAPPLRSGRGHRQRQHGQRLGFTIASVDPHPLCVQVGCDRHLGCGMTVTTPRCPSIVQGPCRDGDDRRSTTHKDWEDMQESRLNLGGRTSSRCSRGPRGLEMAKLGAVGGQTSVPCADLELTQNSVWDSRSARPTPRPID